jgi:tripartite ATP-independent transporter DctP family solute receptor
MTRNALFTRVGSPRARGLAATGLAAASLLALSACGVGTPVDKEAAAAIDSDAKVLRLAHVYDAGHPVEKCGVATLQEELDDSGIQVESFPAAQLGSEAESLEQVSSGSLDMAIAGPSFLGVWHEPVAVLDAAYLFDDVDQYETTFESETIQSVFDELYESSDIKVLANLYYGTRHVTADTLISTAADFSGLKIRTPDAPLAIKNIEAIGGTPTPMSLDEVYLALQQGVIDAQENPVPTIATAKFNEVQDYINLTAHQVQGIQVTIGRTAYEGLTEDERSSLESGLEAASAATRECVEEQEQSLLEEWKSGDGIKVNEDVDREAFAAAAEATMVQQSWGDLYREIKDQQ